MAVKLTDVVDIGTPDVDNPDGTYLDEAPGIPGTPIMAALKNDIYYFFSKIMGIAGITFSGTPDNITTNQFYDALVYVIGHFTEFVSGILTDTIYELTPGAGVTIEDVNILNGDILAKSINELVLDDGVSIEGVILKDGKVDTGYGENNVLPESVFLDKIIITSSGTTLLPSYGIKQSVFVSIGSSSVSTKTLKLPDSNPYSISYVYKENTGAIITFESFESVDGSTWFWNLAPSDSMSLIYKRLS